MLFLIVTLFAVHGKVSAEPEYAKWGHMAVKETMKKYNASIIDYKHIGRTQITPNITEEHFKLWLKNDLKEFGVYVTIKFRTSDDQVISIHFVETDRLSLLLI